MGTVIFDFDSTLIRCESLELIVAPRFAAEPDQFEAYEAMTRAGMEGSWTFRESLVKRLSLAAPHRDDLVAFSKTVPELWTPGIQQLVDSLHRSGHDVWIVSGGFREALVPSGALLGIPQERVLAVQLLWDESGAFAGVDPNDPFSTSKVEGIRRATPAWSTPSVMIGDGMTDRALFEEGLVDHFIPFTRWARRQNVVSEETPEAQSAEEIRTLLSRYLLQP